MFNNMPKYCVVKYDLNGNYIAEYLSIKINGCALDVNFKKVIPFSIVELEKIVEEIKPYFEICYLR